MAKVYLPIGKIAAGKTAWAREREARGECLVLSCDDLLLTLFDGCLREKHAETEQRCLSYLFDAAARLVALGLDAVVDSGFWTAQSRAFARAYFSARGAETVFVYFDVPFSVRLERLHQRNVDLSKSERREFLIDDEALARFDSKFEQPSCEEYDIRITQ